MSLSYDESTKSYQPLINLANGQTSFSVRDISEDDFRFMSMLLSLETPLIIKARLADLLWIIKRDYPAAIQAIAAYKALYNLSINEKKWLSCEKYIKRALQIAISLSRKSDQYIGVCDFIVSELKRMNGEDPAFLSLSLIDALKECSAISNGKEIIRLLDRVIDNSSDNINKLEYAYALKKSFLQQDPKAVKQCHSDLASRYEQYANNYVDDDYNTISSKIYFLGKAVQEYRQSSNKDKEKSLLLSIDILQRKIPNKLASIKIPIEVSRDEVKELFDIIEQSSFKDAIKILTSVVPFCNYEKTKEQLLKGKNNFFSKRLFETCIIDENGRTVISIPPLDPVHPEKDKGILEMHIIHESSTMASINGIILTPIFDIILKKFAPNREDIIALFTDCVLIPEDRLEIFVSAFEFVFSGKIYEAIHILAPQMENLFRHIASLVGDLVFYFDEKQQTEVFSLKDVFNLPNLNECFDNDILFTFKVLLNEKAGSNVRNLIAHGVLSPMSANNPIMVYFVCVVLKLFTENF